MQRELRESPPQRMHHRPRERGLLQVQDILDNVVSEGVDHKLRRVADNLGDDSVAVGWVGVVEASLEHAAAMPETCTRERRGCEWMRECARR